MRARPLAAYAIVLACAHGGPPAANHLPTLTHAQVKPGQHLRLVGVWGREIWSGNNGAEAVAFMPDSTAAVLVGHDVVVFDVASRSPLRRFAGHARGMESVAVSPDGKTIATGGFIDRSVDLWDAKTGARVGALQIADSPGGARGVSGLAYTPDGKRIVAGYQDHRLATFDTATRAVAWTDSFTPDAAGPVDVATSADGKLIAAACGSDGVAVWDAATGRRLWSSNEGGTGIAFQGETLAIVGRGTSDASLVIFDARTGAVKEERRKERGQLAKVAALPGKPGAFVVAQHGSAVTIWDEHGPASMYAHLDGLVDVAVSPDGRYAASVALDDGVRVWDLARRREVPLDGHDSAVVALAPSADGARLTSVGNDGSIFVRSVASGAIVSRRQGLRGPVVAAAFSADGNVGVIASEVPEWWPAETGPGVYVVDGRTAQVRAELAFRFLPATAVAVSADGRAAVALGPDCGRAST
jgi:WD40 repeat protein